MSHPPAPGAVPTPSRGPPPAPKSDSQQPGAIRFFGSQVGGESVINYSYTDMPMKLLMWDLRNFFVYIWFLPWIVWPLTPTDSDDFDELAFNRSNLWCLFVHGVLIVMQLAFILGLPFTFLFPLWIDALGIAAFFFVNWAICLLLNGKTKTMYSDPKFASDEEHPTEQWIFLNGVAAGEAWLMNNINRLALTFRRPIIGIHNRTSGILFDVVECLIQRNFGYATGDVREAYKVVKDKLYNPQYSKVVFILHSQGGIEGGLVLDWLLQELPQDLLVKLEVYTFGCAANHFNNPHLHVKTQQLQRRHASLHANSTIIDNNNNNNNYNNTHDSQSTNHEIPMSDSPTEYRSTTTTHAKSKPNTTSLTMTSSTSRKDTPTQHFIPASSRVIGHIEHYAHTTDFVALWGVLHFATGQMANRQLPRFIGRVFSRTSSRGGHQFCQHYLDGMFPLERAPGGHRNDFVGCAEQNDFMDSVIEDAVGSCKGEKGDMERPQTPVIKTSLWKRHFGGKDRREAKTAATTGPQAGERGNSNSNGNGATTTNTDEKNNNDVDDDEPWDLREDLETSFAMLLQDRADALQNATADALTRGAHTKRTTNNLGRKGAEDDGAGNQGEEEVSFHAAGSFHEKLYRGEILPCGKTVRVKDLSRLWLYRNGRSPVDKPRQEGGGEDREMGRGLTL